jgi:hypothetical protein
MDTRKLLKEDQEKLVMLLRKIKKPVEKSMESLKEWLKRKAVKKV